MRILNFTQNAKYSNVIAWMVRPEKEIKGRALFLKQLDYENVLKIEKLSNLFTLDSFLFYKMFTVLCHETGPSIHIRKQILNLLQGNLHMKMDRNAKISTLNTNKMWFAWAIAVAAAAAATNLCHYELIWAFFYWQKTGKNQV